MQYSQTRYSDTLASGISATALSLTVSTTPPTRTQGILTVGRSSSNTEDVYYTSVAGNVVTISIRGVSQTALTPTEVSGNKKVHNANEGVEITTHHLYDSNKFRIDENETISGSNTYSGTNIFADDKARSSTTASPTTSTSFTNKNYVDTTTMPLSYLDTDGTLAANSDVKIATQKATKTYTDAAVAGLSSGATNASTGSASAAKLILTASDGFLDPSFTAKTYTAYEAITQHNAVALLPVETQWYTQLTDTLVNLGQTNQLRKYAVKYIPTNSGTLTDWNFRAREAVNASTALGNLVISIQTDSGSAPSGTALTNATATISQVTQRTWTATTATRTATFAGSVSVTAGTTYWVVYECSATDGTNYLKFGANDTYVANYLTFTRLTYDLDAATWGSSSTTSILFGWSSTSTVPFGYGACVATNTSGARTWNFVGFALTTVAAQGTLNVYPLGAKANLSTLTLVPKTDYYLSSSGAITGTCPGARFNAGSPSTYSYKLGNALSTTVLQVQTGEKMIWDRITPSGSATTVHLINPWFKPRIMETSGAYLSTANIMDTTIRGIYDGTNNYQYGNRVTNGAAPIAQQAGSEHTTASFGPQQSGAYWTGVGSAITDVGLTYTVTKTSTPSDYSLLYTLKG